MSETRGDPSVYLAIVRLLWTAFAILSVALVSINTKFVAAWCVELLGERPAFFLQLGLWGALGGLVSGYKFLAHDKDLNELEAMKEKPDPTVLRYPTVVDVHLYGQRIVSSGVLGVISGLLVLTGLIYFQVETTGAPLRQRLFMVLLAFVVGLQENDFLAFLSKLNQRLFSAGKSDAAAKKP